MELNGKAKEDFNKWVIQEYPILRHINITEDKLFVSLSNALIIEWFDSVGLNILITCEFDYGYEILGQKYDVLECVKKWYDTRQEAREEAIKKANEIYNKE